MSRLRVYKLSLAMVRLMRPLWEKIGRRNRPLRQQLEKSVPAVPRLIAEGEARRGGTATLRWEDAIAEARESIGSLESAIAAGYLSERETVAAIDKADHVVAILWKLTH